jgi:molybdopterin-synthase adenylyltransferase
MTDISLHIPPQMWDRLRTSMMASRRDREETIGFLLCQQHRVSDDRIRYIPKTWIVPADDCYEYRSNSGLILSQKFHEYLLKESIRPGLDIVHIHTHSGNNTPDFSSIDDRYESEYARFIAEYFPSQPHLISGVLDENLLSGRFRRWNRQGSQIENVRLCHQLFDLGSAKLSTEKLSPIFARQQIFGTDNQQLLGKIKVAAIGCGGIGAIVVELLSRLGVKNWVLVDPDRLETVNLNRMPGATQEMVDRGWYKVEYIKHAIDKIYSTTYGTIADVQMLPNSIADGSVESAIAACDLIIAATDNHYSRQIAQELALKYLRPLVSLGTHIEVKTDGKPRMYARVTVPPLGGNWCLMCGNIINLQQAALESAPAAIDLMAANAGYLTGVDNPSVFWLNSLCASNGAGVIHGMVSGFVDVSTGIDWIFEFSDREWHKTNTTHFVTEDCYFCSLN